MKKYVLIFSILTLIVCSCNKDVTHNTADHVGISTVTHYVTLQLNGDDVMSVVKGETFTDPGVTATENGTTSTYRTSGTVDVNTVGIYVLTYTAVNKDGFSSSATRTVVVIPAHENAGVDVSGSYAYVGSSVYTATISKVAEGVYYTDNCWSGSFIIPCYFICIDGANLIMPPQSTPYGGLNGTGTLRPTGQLVYIVSLTDQGIENSTRNWQKQ